MIVAEHHSIWEQEGGGLVDLTPPLSIEQSALFLRDDAATIQVNNDKFIMRADRTDMPGTFLLKSSITQSEFYEIPFSLPELKDYADELGFDVKRMATEINHG